MLRFVGRICKAGYEWRRGRDHVSGALREFLVPKAGPFQQYRPLDSPQLYREFVTVPGSAEGILEFASRFGATLATHEERSFTPTEGVEAGYGLSPRGAPLEFWLAEHRSLHQAVSLWDMVLDEDYVSLASHFVWERYPNEVRVTGLLYEPRADAGDYESFTLKVGGWGSTPGDPRVLPLYGSGSFLLGDLRAVASAYVHYIVNERLASRVEARLVHSQATDRFDFSLYPAGLLGALWLQFGQDMARRRNARRCALDTCGAWFEGNRKKKFCSDACRVAAHRARTLG